MAQKYKFTCLLIGLLQIKPLAVHAQDLKQRLQIGLELQRAGRWEEARPLYEALYRIKPDDHTVFSRLKDVYLAIREYQSALNLIETRKQKFSDPNLDVAAAEVYYKMGKREEAMTLWENVLDQNPKNPGLYYSVANAINTIPKNKTRHGP